jgi:hypothetical protein
MFEESCSIATLRTTSNEAVMLRTTLGSREVTPSSDREAPSDVATHYAQEGVKGRNQRRKEHLHGTTTATTTSHDDGHNWEVGNSGVRRTSAATHSNKRPVRPPTYHFKMLLEEACPNHTYPVRHELKDHIMMRSFMTSGSLTWGAELDEGLDGSDMMPFPEENAVMMLYGGRPPSGRRRVTRLSPKTPTRRGWGCGGLGV